ncbi:MAG: MBL fold metallo-hydrolase [Tenericutes bacterium]|nr:MBL fold metallo-hydrolase [Mycoplasmatota bacterium]
MKIKVFNQAAIKIESTKNIYFDPYQIKEEFHDADYIFITHDHYDHYDEESIKNIMKSETMIVVPECLKERVSKLTTNYFLVSPNEKYNLADLSFETTFSYNIDKPFHPKEKGYVGYKIKLEDKHLYIMGDTDYLEENLHMTCDICFIPIGGTYTMDVQEAAAYINELKPELAIPIHYGSIVGDLSLSKQFIDLVNPDIKVEVYIK